VTDCESYGPVTHEDANASIRVLAPIRPTCQFALNIVATVRAGDSARLDAALDRIGDETFHGMRGQKAPDPLIDFDAVAGVHYARWVILPGRGDRFQSPGKPPGEPQSRTGPAAPAAPASLAFSLWFDGPEGDPAADEARERDRIVRDLVAVGRRAFDALYENCDGYAPGASDDELARYLLAHHQDASALYFGSPGRSRRQVFEETDLALRVRRIVDALHAQGPLPDAGLVRAHVIQKLGGAPAPFPAQQAGWDALLARGALVVLPALLLLPVTLVALLWLLVLEATDRQFVPVYSADERAHVEVTTRGENLFYQNALSNIVELKGGWFRRVLLRLVLFAINTLARQWFVHGSLGEISSIHAAHWYVLGGDRLAFVSNYDGSWESYLGDFIDEASSGLTAVWSNTSGYPRTYALAFAGSNSGDRFKAWSHHIQVRTRVWYAAYPDLSIVQINDATLIRRGLADPFAVPPETWLKRLT
jgi:hypothetical protein